MVTVDKEHISKLMLLEAYSEKHQAEEKIKLYKNKYNKTFQAFEAEMQKDTEERFEQFDDYMEWKAYQQHLAEINSRIEELKRADIKVA